MRLSLKNTGKISQADIDINGITVIAGENNTGKSTVGRVLFCIFNSFYNIDIKIENERKDSIEDILDFGYAGITNRLTMRASGFEMAEQIIQKNKELPFGNKNQLKEYVQDLYMQIDDNFEKYSTDTFLDEITDKIFEILDVSDDKIFNMVFKKRIQAEFNMQINSIHKPNSLSEIVLKIKDEEIKISIEKNENASIENPFNLRVEAIYIDDPFILDGLNVHFRAGDYVNHRSHLRGKLASVIAGGSTKNNAIEEILATEKVNKILAIMDDKLNGVCKGNLQRTPRSFGYREKDSKISLDIVNISTGIKAFLILKTLLQAGVLEENGTVVLDEPEVHLHPEWQIVFAELIVLIQKEFNMHILLTTHSPYFLNAIDVFSDKHKVADKCNYYLAEDSGNMATIENVNDNLEAIYAKLANAFQVLENERYAND